MARYHQFQRRRPHDLPSLGKVAQMLELAFAFGRIAAGLDWHNPAPDHLPAPPIEQDFEADLLRAYGPRDSDTTLAHLMRDASCPAPLLGGVGGGSVQGKRSPAASRAPSSSSAGSSPDETNVSETQVPLRPGQGVSDATLVHQMEAGQVSDCAPANNPNPENQNVKPETRNLDNNVDSPPERGCVQARPQQPQTSAPSHARRDAWSSWARHLRRRST